MRPRDVYPEYEKRTIMDHINGSGWKAVGFHKPSGTEWYLGRDYAIHPAHAYTRNDPRLIVERIPGLVQRLKRDEDNAQ